MRNISGEDYEQWCKKYLLHKGYHNIQTTPITKDQGVDLTAYKHGIKYAIQCKYYSTPVGNQAIQEVYAGAAYYDCTRWMVITNQSYTPSAIQLASSTDTILWDHCSPTFSLLRSIKVLTSILLEMIAITCLFPPDVLSIASFISIQLSCINLWFSYLFTISWSFIWFILAFYLLKPHAFIFYLSIFLTLLLIILFIIQLIHTIQEYKEHQYLKQAQQKEEQHRKLLYDLQTQLELSLHCHLDITDEQNMIFHADQNVEANLSLAQYDLNQQSTTHLYEIIDRKRRKFQVIQKDRTH